MDREVDHAAGAWRLLGERQERGMARTMQGSSIRPFLRDLRTLHTEHLCGAHNAPQMEDRWSGPGAGNL